MGIAWNDRHRRSSGGTELMARALERRLPGDLLDRFQVHLDGTAPPEPGKIQILWCHLHHRLPEFAHLADGGWQRYERIVFVSNWQAQGHLGYFGIPWSRCVVLHNAIEPIQLDDGHFEPVPADRPIRLIYTSVPDRGLLILYHAFREIARQREDVELDVFSSYQLYGQLWPDQACQPLFDALRQVPRVSYHGAVPNEQLRKELASAHVHAFPSVVPETGCVALMEAMSAGLVCVHPNYGGLYETAAGLTMMYQWHEDPGAHAAIFYSTLMNVINALRAGNPRVRAGLAAQKAIADAQYNWDRRAGQWEAFLRAILRQAPQPS
jgi:glycosyltransferase involved in cell wall biosynthesis